MRFSPLAGDKHLASHGVAFRFVIQLTLLTGLVFCDPLTTSAGQPESNRRVTMVDSEGAEYLGVRRCKLCHDRRPESRPVDPIDKEFGFTDFVDLTEFHTWYDKDKHSQAYNVLEGNLGKQIGRVLGIDVTKSERCLTCHATWRQEYRPANQEIKLGVTCEGCHGPSRRWFIPHMDPPWRAKSPKEKESLGMVDVRNPVNRARQCFSCHLGSAAEGKVVTHAIYAAGHPPLSGMEVETFFTKVPAHWTAVGKKNDAIKQLLHYDPAEKSQTKSVILGGVMALREAVNFFANRVATTRQETTGPDFADYNCYACHHELKKMDWRQRRGYRYTPGYPAMREWPEALVRLGIFQLSKDAGSYQKKKQELRAKLDRLHDAVNSRPFGEPGRIGNPREKSGVSGDLIAWLDRTITELEASRYDQAAAVKALQKLSNPVEPDDPPYAQYPDYDYAKQIAWAMTAVYGDLNPKPANDAEIGQIFNRLHDRLNLEVQADRSASQGKTETSFSERLKSAASYDPVWFKEQLKTLSNLLPK